MIHKDIADEELRRLNENIIKQEDDPTELPAGVAPQEQVAAKVQQVIDGAVCIQ
jgi:hypothetical protein